MSTSLNLKPSTKKNFTSDREKNIETLKWTVSVMKKLNEHGNRYSVTGNDENGKPIEGTDILKSFVGSEMVCVTSLFMNLINHLSHSDLCEFFEEHNFFVGYVVCVSSDIHWQAFVSKLENCVECKGVSQYLYKKKINDWVN